MVSEKAGRSAALSPIEAELPAAMGHAREGGGERPWLWRLASVGLFFLAWEIAGRVPINPAFPTFLETFAALLGLIRDGTLFTAYLSTLQPLLLGLIISAVMGVGLGVAMGLWRGAEWFFAPVFIVLQAAPMAVTTTSEPLDDGARARINEAFGVGVSDMFGSTEGVLGVSPPDDPVIQLASDLAIVELVDHDNRPVDPGTPSTKALVTNLCNRVQPLIRYELTDSFVERPTPSNGHMRVTVEGRRDDELTFPDNVVVHPSAIRSVPQYRRSPSAATATPPDRSAAARIVRATVVAPGSALGRVRT